MCSLLLILCCQITLLCCAIPPLSPIQHAAFPTDSWDSALLWIVGECDSALHCMACVFSLTSTPSSTLQSSSILRQPLELDFIRNLTLILKEMRHRGLLTLNWNSFETYSNQRHMHPWMKFNEQNASPSYFRSWYTEAWIRLKLASNYRDQKKALGELLFKSLIYQWKRTVWTKGLWEHISGPHITLKCKLMLIKKQINKFEISALFDCWITDIHKLQCESKKEFFKEG